VDAENRLVSVTGAATANFYYDADGKQVRAIVDGVATYYVGNHYEVKNSVVTKYYFAGATRLAVRTGGTLSFLLGDHLGSSSVTTNANGVKTASALYKAFGETRYTLGNLGTDYKFTGQREESALGGIYFFQSRWFDPSLGRFMSPDSIVPTGSQGTQAWDRYAFVNNNPVRYNDPTGHYIPGDCNPMLNPNCDVQTSASSDTNSNTDNANRDINPDDQDDGLCRTFDEDCETLFDENLTPDELQKLIDALYKFAKDVNDAKEDVVWIGGSATLVLAALSGYGGLGMGVITLGAAWELSKEASVATDIAKYLEKALPVAQSNGSVRVTIFTDPGKYGGIPPIIYYDGAIDADGNLNAQGITTPLLAATILAAATINSP
jgi:RHS repeat-associated protein